MNDDQVRLYFQVIRQQLAASQKEDVAAWQTIDAVLEDLYLIYEEIKTNLEGAEALQSELSQQNQQITTEYYYYHDLFYSAPVAYLVADVNGVILDANQASARLLNVPQRFLAGKPLILYVVESDRSTFRTNLNRLSQSSDIQVWQMNMHPRDGQTFAAEMHVAIVYNADGLIESLRIGLYNLSRSQQQHLEAIRTEERMPVSQLPQALDGLRVLVVDDEADARDLIAAVLESHGIGVKTVASAAAALEELERFHPDVLVSDIRMPNGDGYSLIRQIRTWEAEQGGHIPAAAITAYLEEDREKALSAGFEAHLHKLAQPTELIAMVAQLAGRTFQER